MISIKKLNKKILSVVLTICLILTMIPITVSAQEEQPYKVLIFTSDYFFPKQAVFDYVKEIYDNMSIRGRKVDTTISSDVSSLNGDLSSYSLLIMGLPNVETKSYADNLISYAKAGGCLVLAGDNNSNSDSQKLNQYLTDLAQAMGTDFKLGTENLSAGDSVLNSESVLTKDNKYGSFSKNSLMFFAANSVTTTDKNASVVAGIGDKNICIDLPVEKGYITVSGDCNLFFYPIFDKGDLASPDVAVARKIFLYNLLDRSISSIHKANPSDKAVDFKSDSSNAIDTLNSFRTGDKLSTWNNDTQTLTLNGVDFTAEGYLSSALSLPDGATVVVNGKNNITLNSNRFGINGIYSTGKLTFEMAENSDLTVTSNAIGKDEVTNCDGINASGIIVNGSGTINAVSNAFDNQNSISSAIFCKSYLTIDGGTVNAKGNGGKVNSCGISGILNNTKINVLDGTLILQGDKSAVVNSPEFNSEIKVSAGDDENSLSDIDISKINSYKYVKVVAAPTPRKITFDTRNSNKIDDVMTSELITLPENLKWKDYTFDGWYTGIDGTGDKVTVKEAKKLRQDTTLYAKWIRDGKIIRTEMLMINLGDPNLQSMTDAKQGWSYNADTMTLTLDGLTLDTNEDRAYGIYFAGRPHDKRDVTVVLKDYTENNIIAEDDNATGMNFYNFSDDSIITIDGKGELNVNSYGEHATAIKLNFSTGFVIKNVDLDLFGTCKAIFADDNPIDIQSGSLKAEGLEKAIDAQQNITTAENALILTGNSESDAVEVNEYTDEKYVFINCNPHIMMNGFIASSGDNIVGSIDAFVSVSPQLSDNNIDVDDPDSPLRYQWYLSKDGTYQNCELVEGATNRIYNLPTDLGRGKYTYFCEVTADGYKDEISALLTFTVTNKLGSIKGTIKSGNTSVPYAKIILMEDGKQVGYDHYTDKDGNYSIDDLEYEINYTLVVTVDDKDIIYKDIAITSDETIKDIIVNKENGNQQASVEISAEDTPETSSDMNDIFKSEAVSENDKGITSEDKNVVENGGSVEIKLNVSKKNKEDITEDANKIIDFADAGNGAKFLFVDLTVRKYVTPLNGSTTTTKLKELNDMIDVEMKIPTEYQKKGLRIVRVHDNGDAEELLKIPNKFGEYITFNNDMTIATLTVKRFSTFALVVPTQFEVTFDNGGTAENAKYKQGDVVTINAGTKDGYTFKNWTTSDGVVLADKAKAVTTFIMTDKSVVLTANWTKNVVVDNNNDGNNGDNSGNNNAGATEEIIVPVKPEKPADKTDNPKTGKATSVSLFMLGGISLAGYVVLRKKRK